jgi:hypothetical protein
MAKRRNFFLPDEPLRNPDHHRPRTRRDFIAQGFALGTGSVLAGSLLSVLPQSARAALSSDLAAQLSACGVGANAGGMIPFIGFDLAGGANFAGSNVLVGGRGGQLDFLGTSGYSVQGLPPALLPNAGAGFVNSECGLAFHSLSALLKGIKATATPAALANTNGSVIAARSENDTSNNPHNPMYGIYRAGARGSLVNLIGTQNSDSGGNSMAPSMLIDVSARPTKVDRPSDVTGLVGTSSSYTPPLSNADTVAAMESMKRISDAGIDAAGMHYSVAATARDSAKCEILKSVDSTDKFGAVSPDPLKDAVIAGSAAAQAAGAPPSPTPFDPIFADGLSSNGEYLKTASVMKLVIGTDASQKHYAAAGTITMGGFDYHTGDRTTGEMRDERAGRCIGACLEYAHRLQVPVMIYVFSDGSVSSSGMIDAAAAAQGKSVWTSDNQGTGSAFFLVYRPGGRATPALTVTAGAGPQIGWFKMDGTVDTTSNPAANSVIQLVDMVVLNYLSLHSTLSAPLDTVLAQALNKPAASILGGSANWSRYIAFNPIA